MNHQDRYIPICTKCKTEKATHKSGVCLDCRTVECAICANKFKWTDYPEKFCKRCKQKAAFND